MEVIHAPAVNASTQKSDYMQKRRSCHHAIQQRTTEDSWTTWSTDF